MQNVIAGATAATTAAPTLHVGTYRRALLAIIIGSPLFTDAEQLRANHNAHECQDAARLALWTRNLLAERDRRQAARDAQGLALMSAGIARFEAKLADNLITAKQAAAKLNVKLAANCPTAAQCDELHQLTLHPVLTEAERAQTRRLWPTFTYATATAYIGKMWVRVLRRGGRLPKGVVPTING